MAPRVTDYVPGWWGEQWLQHLAACGVEPETPGRRRSALRADLRVGVGRGQVRALVEAGSRDVEVVLRVRPLTDRDWRRLLKAVASDVAAAQRLLSGNPGPELAEHCQRQGLALFPPPTGYTPIRCTCNGWNCRHMNALAQQGAMLLDTNPYLWLEVLGRPRAELFAQLRAHLADAGAAAEAGGAGEPLAAARYWQTEVVPDAIPVHPEQATAPAALLASLGAPPLPREQATVAVLTVKRRQDRPDEPGLLAPEQRPLMEVLAQYVTRVAEGAAALALGERARLAAVPSPLPGKPIDLAVRLAPEVVTATRQAGRVLSLAELQQLCPTAAALPAERARQALSGALCHLPADLVAPARAYVGERTTLLAGATFHHVVTFDEQLRGDLSPDADWVRALTAAGCMPPYEVMVAGRTCVAPAGQSPAPGENLFALLRPEVGDRLTLRVVDPATPRLAATLHRRDESGPRPAQAEANEAAEALLHRRLLETRQTQMSETDAVAVLLAEGAYRRPTPPGPVWLLPLESAKLAWPGRDRAISTGWSQWQPNVARPMHGYWPEREVALRWFSADLMHAGHTRREVEAALAAVRRWCFFWPGPQDTPAGVAPLGHLLGFLWLTDPMQAAYNPMLPAALERWFTLLGERHPAVQERYAAHILACRQAEAYSHRCRTLRAAGATARLEWLREGYLWIGAPLFFAPDGGGRWS